MGWRPTSYTLEFMIKLTVTPDMVAEVEETLRSDMTYKKTRAIKQLRSHFETKGNSFMNPMSLRRAKDIVDMIESNMGE